MSGKMKLAALVLFHLAIVLFLLSYDERLNPEIPAFLNGTAATIDGGENAYFAFVGFDAAQGKDIHATGKTIADKLFGDLEKNPLLDKFDRDALLGQKTLFKGKDLLKSSGARFTYFPDVVRRKSDIERLLADNRDLLSRYATLYDYSHYHETTPCSPASLFIIYANISDTHKLILWKIALDVQEGNTPAALSHLRRDTMFWRMVLQESQDLLPKLVAMNAVRQNSQLLSELLVYRPHAAALLPANDPLLCNLSDSENNMSTTMRREFEFNLYLLKQMKRDMWPRKDAGSGDAKLNRFLVPMLKINSSSNILYNDFARLAKVAALPANEFAGEVEKSGQKKREKFGCEILYNLTGAVIFKFVGEGPNTYLVYIQKVHDLDGYLRLINLQLQARQQRIKVEQMQSFLDKADPAFANPYTGRPMQWDGKKGSIFFESIATKDEKRRRVELFL